MEEPIFFPTPARWRAWLHRNHAKVAELWVGYHKKETGRPTMTWSDSVDEALCYGWIDGIRKSCGDGSYKIRFTPRKPTSIWSKVNIAKIASLTAAGKMMPAGVAAYAKLNPKKTGIYSFENTPLVLAPEFEEAFRKNKVAWRYYEAQAPYYRRITTNYVMSARKPETRERRLAILMDSSAREEQLPGTISPAKKKG